MNRRGFIGSIIALGAAPAVVRAESIMRVRPWRIPHLVMRNGVLVPSGLVFVGPELFDFSTRIGWGIRLPNGKSTAAMAIRTLVCDERGFHLWEIGEADIPAERQVKSKLLQWAREQYQL